MLAGLLRYRKVEDVTSAKDEPTQGPYPSFYHSYLHLHPHYSLSIGRIDQGSKEYT